MKQPLPDLVINTFEKIFKSNKLQIILWFVAFTFLIGCKNDMEKINLFAEQTIVPNLSGKNITILRSDSGRLVMRIEAPEIKQYSNIDEPFMEFPKGVDVYFLDSAENVKTHVTANYAIRYDQQNLYYGRDSVVAKNVQTNEWITSEEMYWDENKRIIYSDKFTTINRKDGIYYGRKGFESTQDFSSWKLKKPTAKLNMNSENEK